MSEESIKCPHCGINSLASNLIDAGFWRQGLSLQNRIRVGFHGEIVSCSALKCANAQCQKESLWIEYKNEAGIRTEQQIVPKSSAMPVPDCVPVHIRDDYEEACLVLEDSSKASATLGRRCLQGMIHDFHDIKLGNLHNEILELPSKNVPEKICAALLGMKHIGNVGAHPDRMIDVSTEDARDLIHMLEVLFAEWYVAREDSRARIEKATNLTRNKPARKAAIDTTNHKPK